MSGNYWKTQLVLKRKWFLNKWPFARTTDFQRFVILCDPRTGSTWLHTLLNSNMRIMSYGEILTELGDVSSLNQEVWSHHHSSIQAVGCKIFYEQLCKDEFRHVLEEIASSKQIKLIDLTRQDARAAYSSLKTAEQTGVWSGSQKVRRNKVQVSMSEVEIDSYAEKLEESRTSILQVLNQHSIYSLKYEELMADESNQLNKVQEFLGVQSVSLFSLLQKQS